MRTAFLVLLLVAFVSCGILDSAKEKVKGLLEETKFGDKLKDALQKFKKVMGPFFPVPCFKGIIRVLPTWVLKALNNTSILRIHDKLQGMKSKLKEKLKLSPVAAKAFAEKMKAMVSMRPTVRD